MCPPGTDQTMRSAQVWYFLAPEVKQALQPHPGNTERHSWYSFKISDMLFDTDRRFDAWSLLARPVTPPQAPRIHLGSLGAFDVLSNEILEMVVEHIEERSDSIALGLTCEGFWQILQRHIQRNYTKAAAPWAGTKIAFQGSYCYDLPTPFLEDGLLENLVPQENFSKSWQRFRLFFWLHEKFDKPVGPHNIALKWIEAINSHEDCGIAPARWEQMRTEIACHDLFPKDRPWTLRNLTTKETVHSKIMETKTPGNEQARVGVRFEDVLLMKICWTTFASHGDEKLDHRGVWAGHRFDIVTSEAHSKEEDVKDWRDITDAVGVDLASLRYKLQR